MLLEIYCPVHPITQLSDAKSLLMALHVPELRMMMLTNESSADTLLEPMAPLHRATLSLNGLSIECRGESNLLTKGF